MPATAHSTFVRSVPLSSVKPDSIPMMPAERLSLEFAIQDVFRVGLTYRHMLKQQAFAKMLRVAEVSR